MSQQKHKILQQLAEITPSERPAILIAYLQEQIANAIGISPNQLDVQQPLNRMRIDSLIAVKLRNRLRSDLEVDVTAVKFMEDSSIVNLAIQINAQILVGNKENLNQEGKSISKLYPLTYGQQGLWFLYKVAPQSAAYNIAFTARISSTLNITALHKAFQKLVDRHPTLRTTFSQTDAEPLQEVHATQEVCFEQIDAATCSWDEVTRQAIAAYQRPFDLENGPVLRVSLFTCSAQDHVLLLTIHHIVVDGFSFGILLQELRLLYKAENTNQTVSLPPIHKQYQDFVQWQRQILASSVGENLWAYWQKQLNSELPILKLPTDRSRPSIQNYQGASFTFELPQELTAKLREIAKAEGATLYMTLLTAFQVLLYRYTSQEDIIVGCPVEGRSQAEFSGTVGFFVNMLPLRVNLAGNPQFSQLLSQVRQIVLAALAHQDYPTPLLMERLQINRDPSLLGLFRVSFQLLKLQEIAQDYELSVFAQTAIREDWGGLRLEPFVIPQQEGQNDIVLDMMETQETLFGIFRYNTDLFDATTISRMASHFQTLLAGIIFDPNQQISSLPLLTEAEQHHLLWQWNYHRVKFPQDKCIHHLFEAQVEITPNAVAVVFQDQQLTYQELNTQANQLAHYLRSLKIGTESLVGICTERSLEMIIGLLGILKAGGAYLPLDPAYPQERLTFMLQDAGVSLLLTQQKLAKDLLTQDIRTICLDKDWKIIAQQSEANIASHATSQNLAYVVYTSGSTGKSKGVMVTHHSLVSAYHSWEQIYQLRSLTSHLQMASFSFDVFSGDLIRALCSGAKLVLCPREWLLEPQQLYQLMRKEEIDSAEFVPAVLRNLVQYLERTQQNLHFMQLLVVGSDSLYVRDYQEFQRFCAAHTRLINSYGVSEATIDSTYFIGTQANLSVDGLVPIGHPFANTQIYILDRYLQPVPIGVESELHIGGFGLAQGYLNRPDLTAEKFIPNPFRDVELPTSSRLYKTGDLARYFPDGNIEFLGRIDHQVKIRGFRVELGEIEAVLSTHPQVHEVVAIAHQRNPTNAQIVAYVVLHEQSPNIDELRHFLKQKLPDYMMPSVLMRLEAMPLTPNGKVDRRALPAPDTQQNRQVSFVPPRTPTEEVITNIFASVLQLEQVGIHDNFFELGGHSLLATQIISRLQQTLKVDLPLRQLLASPTPAGISEKLLALHSEAFAPLPTISPAPEQRYQPFPLTDIQQAYWLGRYQAFELGNIAAHGYLELESQNLNLEKLNLAWQQLVLRHDMLRSTILPDGQQQILEQVPAYKITVLDLCGQPPEVVTTQLEAIRQQMSHEVLPTDKWPLFKIRATRINEQLTRLHLSFDALIADALSMFILGEEWSILYQDCNTVLPPLNLSFRDYVLAELALKETPQYHRSQKYWFSRLDTLPPVPELPLAKNPSSITQPKFQRRSAELTPEQWQQLKHKANQHNLTPSVILLSAFAEILSFWSKSARFTINLTLFHRLSLHPQVNNLVGDFTSLTLLEVDNFIPDLFTTRAQKLQQRLWQDLDHGYVSGLQVQRELRRRRDNYYFIPIVFTSTLGLDSINRNISPLSQLGELIYSISQTPQVWLDHQVREQNGALLFNWDAVEELFPVGLLDEMFAAYCNLLQQLATSESAWQETQGRVLPQAQLCPIPTINNTVTAVAQQTLHGLFLAQVAQRASQPAVLTQERTLTYEQLYQLAQQLSQRLRQLGASTNTLVAVVMAKGWEQVVAVLGILMAGAAYLPIDPELPSERQWYLLTQGNVQLAVTQPHLNVQLSWPSSVQRVYVEQQESTNFSPESDPQSSDALAYVIYTSGSTGQPKGVMIEHKAAVNTIVDINQRFGINAADRVLALSSLSFDLSVYDIFGTLAAGGAIVIPAPEAVKDPSRWLELMVSMQVTVWNSVPALMQMLVTYLSTQPHTTPACLRLALLSGDWLPLDLPGQMRSLWHDAQIVSLGGATEASIWSICYPITTLEPHWQSIPYGKPLQNQHFYVFNQWMQPTPVWVPGQLYIGGMGLAKGYWADEHKTQASFVTHPLTQERLYKTGDLGRYLPDGNIEFLGREDFQVKINGYRVELGEIEAALQQHPVIAQAIITAIEEEGHKSLVSYIIPISGQVFPISDAWENELRHFLQTKLPDYMVPSTFVLLESWPLTANGKVDRLALPKPKKTRSKVAKTFVAPRNQWEELLVATWAEVLQFEHIGIHDNFYELGGHSFLALQLSSKINQKLGAHLPLSALFQYPTVAELANFLTTNNLTATTPACLVPIQVHGTQPPLFCIHPAGGQVIVYQHLSACLGQNQPIYGLQSRALHDPDQEHDSIENMAIDYAQVIRQHQLNGPYYLIGWSMGGVIAVSIAKQLEQQGQEVIFVGLVDAFLIPDNSIKKHDPLEEMALVLGNTFIDALMALDTHELQSLREELVKLPAGERWQRIIAWGQEQKILSKEISLQLLQQQIQLTEIHEQLLRVHQPPQIHASLHIWWALDRLQEELPYTDWSLYTTGATYINFIGGNHFTVMQQPHIETLAQELREIKQVIGE